MLPRPLLRVGGKAGLKAVERQLVRVPGRQARGGKQLGEVLVDVAPKVGGIIRVDGDGQPRIQQLAQVVVSQVGEDAKLLV